MNLIYFTKEAYKLLKKDLNLNRDKYYSDEPWLDEYFASAGTRWRQVRNTFN